MNERVDDLRLTRDLRRGGDARRAEVAFDAAFAEHYDGVFRLLYRMLGDRPESEDLAQETFLRLYRQVFHADRPQNLRAWLYRVASNLALNVRRGDVRRTGRETVAGRQGPPPADDPAELVVRRSEQAAVRSVLAGLPARQRQLLMLRHAGLRYRELAEVLDVAPASVGTLLARAEAAFAAAYRASAGARDETEDGPHAL
jgi:RNA polymerase sigma-70 factor (ECF subfamily)